MPALHGFIVECPFATPTIGFSKSPSPKPTARSMARFGERATPWVMRRERRFAGVVAIVVPPWSRAFCPRGRSPIQCRRRPAVIPFKYESPRNVAASVFHGPRREAPFRSRGGRAAYFAAAPVARDPRARGARRRAALRPHPAPRRADAGRRAPARGGAA